jgi:hypothetical protein
MHMFWSSEIRLGDDAVLDAGDGACGCASLAADHFAADVV